MKQTKLKKTEKNTYCPYISKIKMLQSELPKEVGLFQLNPGNKILYRQRHLCKEM